MEFLKEVEKQSQILIDKVNENKKENAMITIANDGKECICLGAGSPVDIAHMILKTIEHNEQIQQAIILELTFKHSNEMAIEKINKTIDDIINKLI